MADNIPGGAVVWARQTLESEIFFYKPDKWFKIWFFIMCRVNHKDNKLFKRGTNLITYKDISEQTKATKNQIDKFIRWAKEQQMLTTDKTTRGMIVSVCNYAFYQNLDNYRDDTKVDSRTKHRRNADDTINKNEKNDNNENKKDIDKREKSFSETILPFVEKYGQKMCEDFYLYWSEKNQSGTKMRFELQKTWDVSKRLTRWHSNNFNGGFKNGKAPNKTPEELADRAKRLYNSILNETGS